MFSTTALLLALVMLFSPMTKTDLKDGDVGTQKLFGTFVSGNVNYEEEDYISLKNKNIELEKITLWKGDQGLLEIVLLTGNGDVKNVEAKVTDFVTEDGDTIPADALTVSFLDYTKAYNGKLFKLGKLFKRPIPDIGLNRTLSPDIVSNKKSKNIDSMAIQPLLLKFKVPDNAEPGIYTGGIMVNGKGIDKPLNFELKVNVKDIKVPENKSFDIELWQYPYSSAEYYSVEPFSKEHFKILKPIMELYKEQGGHAITCSISEDAWNGQTYSGNKVHYPSMIRWNKNPDGSFSYDYTDFDRWVQFNRELGIGDKIVLYSVVPWHGKLTYYENGRLKKERAKPGSPEYNKAWSDFLKDLTKHLEENGWYDDCYIGIDERGFCKEAFDLVESVKNSEGKSLKMAGAVDNLGKNNQKFVMRMDDINIGDSAAADQREVFSKLLEERKKQGLRTTLYSCTGHNPGNFTLSEPVESYWSVLNAGAKGTDGFLRWAYDAWVKDPLRDTTHFAYEPGDCFLIYPDKKTAKNPTVQPSIRLEMMGEAVRNINKIRFLVEDLPELQSDYNKIISKVKFTPYCDNNYLKEEEIGKIELEKNEFKHDLNKLTDKYLEIKETGSSDIVIE